MKASADPVHTQGEAQPRATAQVVGKIEVLSSDADYTSARYEDLVLQVWHAETTTKGIAAVRAATAAAAHEVPEKLRLLVVLEADARMPSADSRADLANFMRDYRDRFRASALAFEGTGFRAASIRAVVTGLSALARHSFPHAVFASISDALAWPPMAPIESATDAAAMAELVRAFRGALRSR